MSSSSISEHTSLISSSSLVGVSTPFSVLPSSFFTSGLFNFLSASSFFLILSLKEVPGSGGSLFTLYFLMFSAASFFAFSALLSTSILTVFSGGVKSSLPSNIKSCDG